MFFVRWEFSFEIASENCLFKKNLEKIINLICFFNFQGVVFRELFFNRYFLWIFYIINFLIMQLTILFWEISFYFFPLNLTEKTPINKKSQFIILLIFPFTWSCVTLTESCVGDGYWKKKEGSERCSSQFYSYFLNNAKH